MNIQYPVPVIHEFSAFLNVPDLALYQSIIHYFSLEVQDKYNHFILLDNKDFKFRYTSLAKMMAYLPYSSSIRCRL